MKFKTELIHPGKLTPRESEILCLLCSAMSDKDIGRTLAISLATVGSHLISVYLKLGIHHAQLNRRMAVMRVALASGMVRLVIGGVD